VPAEVQKRWRPMVETYLTRRANLRGMVLLLDIRREPSKEDLNLWHWLQTRSVEVVIVITKVDKLSRNKRNKQIAAIVGTLEGKKEEVIEFSAITGEGREKIWKALLRLLEPGD
jgi:GTP-binding protein